MDEIKKQRLVKFLAAGLVAATHTTQGDAEKRILSELEKGRGSNEIIEDILKTLGKKMPKNLPNYHL